MLNREKTTIFFNQAVNEETKDSISNFLGILELKEYEKYLGLPAVVGRNKKVSLNYIKERVWSKLQGWKEKLLSQASRGVLLKLWYKQFLHSPWVVSSYHWVYVTRLSHWLENFDGDKGEQQQIHWKSYVSQNQREGWGSKIWWSSMKQCWRDRFRD